ncbi:MAG: M14 family zinc carboxypeptidase [Bryobacteraceae bacterium]
MLKAIGLLLAALAAGPVSAQKPFEFWPGASYDSRIPTYEKVLGYAPGERITAHAGLLQYLDALAAASPRLKVFDYAKSWQGRRLVYAAVGSEANMRRLPEIRAAMQRLADPRRTPDAEARKLIANLPAVVWLGYGVHGNEISSPDAALLTAYHFLAARNDKLAEQVLANTLLIIIPTQNPDGRDRFLNHFEEHRGLEPDPSPYAAEHNESWPSGRSNHYLFDLNRDWLALTQPEISGQVKALLEWYPLVYVDLHEMGSDTSYFFAPEADPFNPHLVDYQRETLKIFGKNNARWFDHFGFDYFTRDVFDAFYPGYGASWPSYHGAVSMTYEQASARGLVVRRSDGKLMTFRDSVQHHFVASLSTAETAAANRTKLLNDFYRYRVTAIEEGRKEAIKEYILPRGRDYAATDKIAALLVEQGVEVKRAAAPFRAGGREYAAGTYVVPLAQPAKRLVRTLLDPDTPMDKKFLTAEEERRRRKARSEIYDVTAWSLPLMFNVEAVAAQEPSQGQFEPAKPGRIVPGEVRGKASVAYLARWGSAASARLLTAALRQDLRVLSSDKAFQLNGDKFPSGTLIFKVKDNPADLSQRLARLAASTGAEIVATDTGWVDDGPNFGSRYVNLMRKPAVALVWDMPTSSTAAGATRFVLERQYGYPVTPVRAMQLAAADLSKFQVIILPPATNYAQILGPNAGRRLKDWVSAGGTLIGLAEAVSYLSEKTVDLLAVQQENLAREGEAKKPEAPQAKDDPRAPGKVIASLAEFAKAILPERELPDSAAGVLARARIDPNHWITAGMGETVNALVGGRSIFTPIKLDKGVNAAYFDAADKLLAGGYLWEENRKQLAFKPLLVVQPEGRGFVIGFTADPNYRAYMDGMNVLFLNAVFRGPAHARH